MTTEYEALQAAVRNNPDLPLTWQQVIKIDETKFTPEQLEKLRGYFEQIQTTETGQDVLREILLREDHQQQLVVTRDDEVMGTRTSAAAYENSEHIMYIAPQFFSDDNMVSGRTHAEIYLVHELGHAADTEQRFLYDAQQRGELETIADVRYRVGIEEMEAENWARRYSEERGFGELPTYHKPLDNETYASIINNDIKFAADLLISHYYQQAIIDGKTREEALKILNDRVIELETISGKTELSNEVERIMNSPAPRFDRNDFPISTHVEPEASARGGGPNDVGDPSYPPDNNGKAPPATPIPPTPF